MIFRHKIVTNVSAFFCLFALIFVFLTSCSNMHKINGSTEILYISDGYTPEYSYWFRGGFIAKKTGIRIFGMDIDIGGDYETILRTDGTITDFIYENYSEKNNNLISAYFECLNQISNECYDKWKKYEENTNLFSSDILVYEENTYVIFERIIDGQRECILFSLNSSNKIIADREFVLSDTNTPHHLLAVYDDACLCVNDSEWFDFDLTEKQYEGGSIDSYYLGKEQIKDLLMKSSDKINILSEETKIYIKVSQLVKNDYYVIFNTEDVGPDDIKTTKSYFAEFDKNGNMMRLGRITGFIPDHIKIVNYNSEADEILDVSF